MIEVEVQARIRSKLGPSYSSHIIADPILRHPTSNSIKLGLGSDSQESLVVVDNILPKTNKPEAEGEIKDRGETNFTTGFSSETHITGNLAQTKVWSNVSQQGMGSPYQF